MQCRSAGFNLDKIRKFMLRVSLDLSINPRVYAWNQAACELKIRKKKERVMGFVIGDREIHQTHPI